MDDRETMLDLAPVFSGQVAGLLDGVRDENLGAATPCEEYTIGELLRHLLGLTLAFRDAGRKELGPTTGTPPERGERPPLTGDWRGRLRTQLGELVAAWREPAAWQGATQAGGVDLPAAIAGRVALNELLLHGWDLARATGQPYAPDDASALVSVELLSQATDADRAGFGFGAAVPVPPEAPPLNRAVGLSGRRPSWPD